MMSEATAARLEREIPQLGAPTLLCELEPWYRVFGRNLADILLQRDPPPVQISSPAALVHYHAISTGVDGERFFESGALHVALLIIVYLASTVTLFQHAPKLASPFADTRVEYRPLSEYLPPINSGSKGPAKLRKGQPKLAKQEILSVPPEADNTRQTVVTPPNLKLNRDLALPNIVAWSPSRRGSRLPPAHAWYRRSRFRNSNNRS